MKKLLTILLLLIGLAGHTTVYQIKSTATYHQFSELPTLVAGDIVQFSKGETFEPFTIAQSGSVGNPITITSYGTGAAPIINGFQIVTGWTNEGGGIYSKVITPESAPNMLLIDGVQYALGRTPNSSYLHYESYSTNVSITDTGIGTDTVWTGAIAVIEKNGYTLDRCLITDHTGDVLTYTSLGTTRTPDATGEGNYFIQNDIRTLNQYGEWFYNSSTGKLSVYFGGVNPTTKTTKVAVKTNLATNAGYDNITIDGLTFQGSSGAAINMTATSDNITVQNCSVLFSGGDAINILGTGKVDNCIISDANGGGINLYNSNAIVTNNTLTNIGSVQGMSNMIVKCIGIQLTTNGNDYLVQYNHLDNIGYMGIYTVPGTIGGSTGGRIAHNFINRPSQVLFDAGGIYEGHLHSGLIIEYNIVLNSGGNGIYMDEETEGVTTRYNTIAYAGKNGIDLHKAHGNNVHNNTIFSSVENNIYQHNATSTVYLANNTLKHNISVVTALTGSYAMRVYAVANEIDLGLGIQDSNYYARPIDDDYVFYTQQTSTGAAVKTLATYRTLSGQESHSLGSPIAITNSNLIQFEYNATNTVKYIVLSNPMIDMAATKYSGVLALQPYTSKVLLIDPNPAPASNPSGASKPALIGTKPALIGTKIGLSH